jgi:hypothetical protein
MAIPVGTPTPNFDSDSDNSDLELDEAAVTGNTMQAYSAVAIGDTGENRCAKHLAFCGSDGYGCDYRSSVAIGGTHAHHKNECCRGVVDKTNIWVC